MTAPTTPATPDAGDVERIAALAARCEAATGADRELDAEIIRAIGGKLKSSDWWIGFAYIGRVLPAYTASLDAAMTLIPDPGKWSITAAASEQGWEAWVWMRDGTPPDWRCAATPALALSAAALRARAHIIGETK